MTVQIAASSSTHNMQDCIKGTLDHGGLQLVWMDVGGGWDGREHQGELQAGCGSLCSPSQGAVGPGMAWPGGSGCQRHLLDLCCHQCPHKRHSRSATECKPLKYANTTIPLIQHAQHQICKRIHSTHPTRTTGFGMLHTCTKAYLHHTSLR